MTNLEILIGLALIPFALMGIFFIVSLSLIVILFFVALINLIFKKIFKRRKENVRS